MKQSIDFQRKKRQPVVFPLPPTIHLIASDSMLTILNVLDLFPAKDDFMEMKTFLLFVLIIGTATAVNWQDSGNVRWAFDCDFYGNGMWSEKIPGEQCGPKCESIG